MTTPSVRSQVRAAIESAWQRAAASGALPALSAETTPPALEVDRPANADHGDLSTNLAMKLARPLRMSPLAIATALVAELNGEATDDSASTPVAGAAVAPRGSSTCA